jgi:hypothetical protein
LGGENNDAEDDDSRKVAGYIDLGYLYKAADRREKPGKKVSNKAVCGFIETDEEFPSRLDAMLSMEGCNRAAWVAAAVSMKRSIGMALLGMTREEEVVMIEP